MELIFPPIFFFYVLRNDPASSLRVVGRNHDKIHIYINNILTSPPPRPRPPSFSVYSWTGLIAPINCQSQPEEKQQTPALRAFQGDIPKAGLRRHRRRTYSGGRRLQGNPPCLHHPRLRRRFRACIRRERPSLRRKAGLPTTWT